MKIIQSKGKVHSHCNNNNLQKPNHQKILKEDHQLAQSRSAYYKIRMTDIFIKFYY